MLPSLDVSLPPAEVVGVASLADSLPCVAGPLAASVTLVGWAPPVLAVPSPPPPPPPHANTRPKGTSTRN
ncbi:hypothetical protein [Nannocystis radixulma]|uniref:Secreted protein n=1 Tax=Nannocystis radixulma TaxID=2995305 RepID=A0ABT5B626_9BACT|nr:hypothetical protein [Nannocystis radixulma]MDC0669575.1 hypothetical protein [Nannocystis radixulma]